MSRQSQRQRPLSLASALLFLSASTSPYFCASAQDATSPNSLATSPVPIDDRKCNCFVTNGSDTAYFSRHAFYDFRSLGEFASSPQLLPDAGNAANAPATSSYFTSPNFTSFWESQNWNTSTSKAPVLRVNSLNNIYIEKNGDDKDSATWLTLRTARHASFQSAAEIVTQNATFQFLSMRMLARTIGDPGGCMGMFTYREESPAGSSGLNHIQEVDLEVLTKYPRDHVQCTNQPALDDKSDIIEAATRNVTLPDSLGWDDWAVYRLDWTPQQSTWYVNGHQIANISFQTPRDPTSIHINAWSNGDKWTGEMANGTQAHLQIQWWEVLYNVTANGDDVVPKKGSKKRDGDTGGSGSCNAVCSIDVGGAPGQAKLVAGNATDDNGGGNGAKNGALGRSTLGWSSVIWAPLAVGLFFLYPVLSL